VEIEAMDAGLAQQVEKPRGLEPGEALRLLEDFALDPEALPEDHPGRRFPHQAVIAMLEPAWERLLRQVQMTFSHHAVTLGNEQVSHLIVSGPLGTDAGLLTFLSERLGLPCRPLDPLAPENLGRLGLKGPMLALEERLPYVMAAGLTGSARGECNLLFTYRQKEEEDRADTLNKVVVLCWLGLAVVAAGVDGIVLPKVEAAHELQTIDWLIGALEREAGVSRSCGPWWRPRKSTRRATRSCARSPGRCPWRKRHRGAWSMEWSSRC